MTDKDHIAETHATVKLMFPMVQKVHDTLFVGNSKDSLVTQVSKNTDMRKSIHRRVWALTISFVAMLLTVAGRWMWERLKGQ